MNAPQLENKKGFTIIEVVLVLAIAALIFLMVFIALPALQRNQRDTARKSIQGKVTSAITSYQSNNRGRNPTTGAQLNGYLDGTVNGSDTVLEQGEYTVTVDPRGAGPLADGGTGAASTTVIQIVTGARCADDQTIDQGTLRSAIAIVQLENGDAFVCQGT